jgi:CHASE1-domain containing sensor protein
MLRSIEVLYSVRSLYAAQRGIEADSFERFVDEALKRQPELQALSWNPVVSDGERVEFERKAGFPIRERDRSGRLGPAARREFYVPVSLIQPMTGNNEALGYDLSSDPLRRQSLDWARENKRATGTAALRLAQGPTDLTGFLVVLPVTGEDPPEIARLDRLGRGAGAVENAGKHLDLLGVLRRHEGAEHTDTGDRGEQLQTHAGLLLHAGGS